MKIIAGKYKGYNIPVARDSDYRPSKGKVKEALFSMLESRDLIKDAFVLDLFCGTGALALEAMSRGAKLATAIDIDRRYVNSIQSTIDKYNIEDIEVYCADATKLYRPKLQYDVVFIDPPYNKELAIKSLKALDNNNWLKPGATCIIELSKMENIEPLPNYKELDRRSYGNTKILIWQYEKI